MVHDLCPLFAGIRKGDRVAIYMPMIPELVVAMLACARLGALHSIVVGSWTGKRYLVGDGKGWGSGEVGWAWMLEDLKNQTKKFRFVS